VNEVLTHRRSRLYAATRKLVKSKLIDSTWTMDGSVKIKLLDKTIVSLTREEDVEKHVPGASDVLQGFLGDVNPSRSSTPFPR
jgi:hypothetical protein